MPATDQRPTIVVSQCLGFAPVRYNGAIIEDDAVREIARVANILQVCPEVGIGLGVPRDPIQIEVHGGSRRLRQPATGRDITRSMHDFAQAFLDQLPRVHGFILKARSPSCGVDDVKQYDELQRLLPDYTTGRFAAAVLARFGHLPVTDEAALRDAAARRDFLFAARAAMAQDGAH